MISELPEPLREAIITEADKKVPYPRKDSFYKKDERQILDKWKSEFLKKSSTEERQSLFKCEILVDIFNYWYTIREVKDDITDEEMSWRIKVSPVSFLTFSEIECS